MSAAALVTYFPALAASLNHGAFPGVALAAQFSDALDVALQTRLGQPTALLDQRDTPQGPAYLVAYATGEVGVLQVRGGMPHAGPVIDESPPGVARGAGSSLTWMAAQPGVACAPWSAGDIARTLHQWTTSAEVLVRTIGAHRARGEDDEARALECRHLPQLLVAERQQTPAHEDLPAAVTTDLGRPLAHAAVRVRDERPVDAERHPLLALAECPPPAQSFLRSADRGARAADGPHLFPLSTTPPSWLLVSPGLDHVRAVQRPGDASAVDEAYGFALGTAADPTPVTGWVLSQIAARDVQVLVDRARTGDLEARAVFGDPAAPPPRVTLAASADDTPETRTMGRLYLSALALHLRAHREHPALRGRPASPSAATGTVSPPTAASSSTTPRAPSMSDALRRLGGGLVTALAEVSSTTDRAQLLRTTAFRYGVAATPRQLAGPGGWHALARVIATMDATGLLAGFAEHDHDRIRDIDHLLNPHASDQTFADPVPTTPNGRIVLQAYRGALCQRLRDGLVVLQGPQSASARQQLAVASRPLAALRMAPSPTAPSPTYGLVIPLKDRARHAVAHWGARLTGTAPSLLRGAPPATDGTRALVTEDTFVPARVVGAAAPDISLLGRLRRRLQHASLESKLDIFTEAARRGDLHIRRVGAQGAIPDAAGVFPSYAYDLEARAELDETVLSRLVFTPDEDHAVISHLGPQYVGAVTHPADQARILGAALHQVRQALYGNASAAVVMHTLPQDYATTQGQPREPSPSRRTPRPLS